MGHGTIENSYSCTNNRPATNRSCCDPKWQAEICKRGEIEVISGCILLMQQPRLKLANAIPSIWPDRVPSTSYNTHKSNSHIVLVSLSHNHFSQSFHYETFPSHIKSTICDSAKK